MKIIHVLQPDKKFIRSIVSFIANKLPIEEHEILYVNSIFYNNDDIVVIDSNNNMYNIIKNKISKVEDKKVSEVKKEDDKIVVFFNTFETKEYDFVFDKAIYINNSMYVNFESKE